MPAGPPCLGLELSHPPRSLPSCPCRSTAFESPGSPACARTARAPCSQRKPTCWVGTVGFPGGCAQLEGRASQFRSCEGVGCCGTGLQEQMRVHKTQACRGGAWPSTSAPSLRGLLGGHPEALARRMAAGFLFLPPCWWPAADWSLGPEGTGSWLYCPQEGLCYPKEGRKYLPPTWSPGSVMAKAAAL